MFPGSSKKRSNQTQAKRYLLVFLIFVGLHLGVWYHAKDKQASWLNIPPAPSAQGMKLLGLGDAQYALRIAGLTLQNMGDSGGRTVNLKEYDYARLKQWLDMSYGLDRKTNFFPMLAAYYFGAVRDDDKLGYIVDYLAKVGNEAAHEKWRWLAQAVFIARFYMKDNDLAMGLAEKLAAIEGADMPAWTKQMPAFVRTDRGEKQAARDIMETILLSDLENLDPNEINYMCAYIRERLSDGTQTIYRNKEVENLCAGRP